MVPKNVFGRHFGFIPGRLTENAIVKLRRMISSSEVEYAIALLFDISGAFNNVWLSLILDSLKDRNCPKNVFDMLRSYFSDRRMQTELMHEIITKKAKMGCSWNSVLGPTCWNVMFDGLFHRLERVVPGQFAAYAGDLIVMVSSNSEGNGAKRTKDRRCYFILVQISQIRNFKK